MPDVVRKHASLYFYDKYDNSVGNVAFLLVQEWIK